MNKMLRSVEKLIRDARYGKKSAKYGNHSMEQTDKTIKYYYHWTAVCVVDKATNTVTYDDGGFSGHSSTTRTINSYKSYYC